MYLGIRRVRSAGRTSGSIEITLPAQLQVLVGIDCRLVVRDGNQPEIVLQPDLSAPYRLIKDLWQKIRLSLGELSDIGDFTTSDFTSMLFPPDHWQERPPLVYADALKALKEQDARGNPRAESLVSLLSTLAIVAAQRLGLDGTLALAFGDALTYLVTGSTAGLGTDFERGMAHQVLEGEGTVKQDLNQPLSEQTWLALRPVVRRVYEQLRQWQADPDAYAAARENWFRAFTADVAVGMSAGSDYMKQIGRLDGADGKNRRYHRNGSNDPNDGRWGAESAITATSR